MGILEGKVVLVSRVTEFVGAAVCKSCIAEGAIVVAQDPVFADTETVDAFKSSSSCQNITTTVDPDDLVAEVVSAHGRLDGVVPNDGFPAIRAPVEDADIEDMKNGIDAMIIEPFRLIGAAVAQMKKQGSGRIVMTTSAAPLQGLANYSMYCTARGAQNSMVLSLSKELAKSNIAINAVAPNFVENPSYFPEDVRNNETVKQKILSQIPLGRFGKAEEASDVVAFLLSEKAGYITGHVVPTAGGWA